MSHQRIKDIEREEDHHHRHHDAKQSIIEGFEFIPKKDNSKFHSIVYPPPHVPSSFKEHHVFSRPLEWSWIISKG